MQVTPSSKVVGDLAQVRPMPCPVLLPDNHMPVHHRSLQALGVSGACGGVQFMVQNDLDEHSLVEKAGSLSFPSRHVWACGMTSMLVLLTSVDNAADTTQEPFCNRV